MIARLLQRVSVVDKSRSPSRSARRLQVPVQLGRQLSLGGEKTDRQLENRLVVLAHGVAPLVVDGVVVAAAKGSNAAMLKTLRRKVR